MISPNNFETTTAEPGSSTLTEMVFWMLISRSDAVRVRVPSSFASRRIPFRTGRVVLVETAFETVFNVLDKICWLHVIFIISSRLPGQREPAKPYYIYINL